MRWTATLLENKGGSTRTSATSAFGIPTYKIEMQVVFPGLLLCRGASM